MAFAQIQGGRTRTILDMAQLNKYAKHLQTGPGITNETETTGAKNKPRTNGSDLTSSNSKLEEPISDKKKPQAWTSDTTSPECSQSRSTYQ